MRGCFCQVCLHFQCTVCICNKCLCFCCVFVSVALTFLMIMWFDSFQPASDIPHSKPSKLVHIMILPVRALVTFSVVIHTVIQQRDRIHVALCVVRRLSWGVSCILFCSGGRAKEELGVGGGHRKRILPSQKGGSDTAAVPFTHLDRVTAAVPFTQIDRVVLGLPYQIDELLIILCTVDSVSQLLPLSST